MSERELNKSLVDPDQQFKGEVKGGSAQLLSVSTRADVGDSVLINGDGFIRLSTSQARLSEAVKVLEDAESCLRALADDARTACNAQQHPALANALFDADQVLHKAKAFLATIGEEK